ncbi:MFS transporter [Microlunatus soli]|uniref:Predicted arabinose efflux permease, MFS family n=1 Tax=Microlunatus soli TaxID=630515 RepID=A0A1H1XBC2_9ACTN|nr:MFS transporter [Microlunatus soli]SDT05996.1 Predicted arabinose efflux permease, MFS family [Microlunatus soli]
MTTATLRAAQAATFAIFGLNGLLIASWTARLPVVADIFGLSPGGLGLLLLMVGLGSVLGLPLAGGIVDRLGTAGAVRAAGALLGVAMSVIAVSLLNGWLFVCGAALFCLGFGVGVWDVAQNIEGAEVERRGPKTIMPKFHAAFSGGAFVGALLGGLLAHLGVPLWSHLFGVVALGTVVVIIVSRSFLPAHAEHPDDEQAPRSRWAAWAEPRTLAIGLVVLAAALTEGAANDWVAKATVDGMGASGSGGAIMFAVFVASMTIFRYAGSALLDRFGRVATLRGCLAAAIVGLLIFVFAPSVYLAAVGAVLWGAGAALGFPVGMSAGADEPRHAAARVSVVSTVGYGAFLLGPPLLGLLGDHVGIRHALLAVAAVCLISFLSAPAVRPRPSDRAAATTGPGGRVGDHER